MTKPPDPTDVSALGDEAMAQALRARPVLLLPLGAVESHGDHLPAGTDTVLAARLCEALVKRVGGATPLLRLPVMPFGQVWSLADAPGSFGVSGETVTRAIVEIAGAAKAKGLHVLAVVNAHLGNGPAIREAQRRMHEEGFTVADFFYPGADAVAEEVRERPRAHPAYMHACEIETSYALHLAPEIVDMDRAVENYPTFPADFGIVPYRWTDVSPSPVLGDPRAASAEKGARILDAVLERMAAHLAALHKRQFEARGATER